MQYELSQEESDLLKAGLHFSIQPDKIRGPEIFTSFEKIHHLFLKNTYVITWKVDKTRTMFYNISKQEKTV